MKQRCEWVPAGNDLYEKYHDTEWGVPVHDDTTHFEFLILEGAQAGLSWETILKRRDGYRKVFSQFDPHKVARMSEQEIQSALKNPGIIRNQLKVRSAVKNANVFLEIQQEFGSFDSYIWKFVGNKVIDHHLTPDKEYPSVTPESEQLSQDLKKRGMNFVGPTIMYAHLQATGLINDHQTNCFRYSQVKKLA